MNAEPADTSALAVPEGVSTESVIQNYIDAIGGREKLTELKDRTTVMTGKVQGFDVKMTVYQKSPDKLRQEVTASGLDQVIIYNGNEGVMIMGGSPQRLPEEELNRLKYEAMMGLILNPDSAGVKMELEGIEKIDNKNAYRVSNTAGSIKWLSYYDAESGLRILEIKEVNTPSGTFKQEIRYSDYRDVDGLKYPYSIDQKLGPQEISFDVSSIKLNQGLDDELFEID
jgi:zinc protease